MNLLVISTLRESFRKLPPTTSQPRRPVVQLPEAGSSLHQILLIWGLPLGSLVSLGSASVQGECNWQAVTLLSASVFLSGVHFSLYLVMAVT